MSDLTPPVGSSAILPLLADMSDFDRWVQDFQIACQYNGIWNLFTGDEKTIPDPAALPYEEKVAQATTDAVVNYWQHRQDADLEN
ncbi:hypothetical protein H2200_010413 [Cladophialophora chaetospira]|uniref:Uncharacterized protein n=1 Tax=Cladophialophora chaetospira TaxID=386627 RepID=A0AA38X1F5_9EURO|nr:hypothetical protein H2200_010413 [Cladophialophora chaetospira]